MRDLLFPSPPPLRAWLRSAGRVGAVAFSAECRAITAMVEAAEDEQREFVAGEVGCVLHLAPATTMGRVTTALAVCARPRLLAGLDHGQLTVGQARAVLDELEHLDTGHASAVLEAVLGDDPKVELDATPGELRSSVKRAILLHDPELARRRHETAKRTAGVYGRPLPDGMGQVVIDCTAVQMATALAAIAGRAAAMSFQPDPETGPDTGGELSVGQRKVAAFLHALGCERTQVQAVLECPVEQAVDVHAAAHAPVWTVGVRMPVAVALGLSDHPAVRAGYGPIDADQARALLPTADLLQACVDPRTGQVLTASGRSGPRAGTPGTPTRPRRCATSCCRWRPAAAAPPT